MQPTEHGMAIVCERQHGYTVAWVDDERARRVPPGWFIEWWPERLLAFAGRIHDNYARNVWAPHKGDAPRRTWMDWADAAAWCQKQAARAQRKREAA